MATSKTVQRLVREFQRTQQSNQFDVSLPNKDDIFHWEVKIKPEQIDSQTPIYKKLKDAKQCIVIAIEFGERFPFDAPFVFIKSPELKGPFVFENGALCMELLSKKGWSSVYSVDTVITQIIGTAFHVTTEIVSFTNVADINLAKSKFRALMQLHPEWNR
eukprot:Opistho-2@43481